MRRGCSKDVGLSEMIILKRVSGKAIKRYGLDSSGSGKRPVKPAYEGSLGMHKRQGMSYLAVEVSASY